MPGNRIQPLRNGREIFPAMLAAIDAARSSVEFETYVYWEGEIADRMAETLAAAARRGVAVRVLLDGAGAIPMAASAKRTLEDSPVEMATFEPPHPLRFWRVDNRSHRKILVCDGTTGFTGGVGIAHEWEGDARNPQEWRDTHFRIDGPAVAGLRAAFFHHWMGSSADPDGSTAALTAGSPDPGTAGPDGSVEMQVVPSEATGRWTRARTLFGTLFRCAERRLRITTAYLVPDQGLVDLLVDARKRDVDVEILVPGPHIDYRLSQLAGETLYEPLLDAGVRIARYQPTMLHSKVITVDGFVSCIGSLNMNQRSVGKDDEIAVVALDRTLADALDRDFDRDRGLSERVEPGHRWDTRPWWRRAGAHFSRLFGPQL